MKISVINNNIIASKIYNKKTSNKNTSNQNNYIESKNLLGYNQHTLNNINSISFSGLSTKKDKQFSLNLSMEELEKRTSSTHLKNIQCLTPESEEYLSLADGDKAALVHLVTAAKHIDSVFMQQDDENNLAFQQYLERKIQKGNRQAALTKTLFDAQIGLNALDTNSSTINLATGIQEKDGKGFYPSDLSKEEFHQILKTMLKNGEREKVANILSTRTMVVRDGDKLKGIDYTEAFKKEFALIANELEAAASKSTNKDFNEYLLLQAKALRTNNPQLDADADKKWATLQDTPLEFTISREQYADSLTDTVVEDEELTALLKENNITPLSKDSLGIRVGIVNKKGTEDILRIKTFLPLMAENMPLKEQYEQNFSTEDDNLQTMVDVDLVTINGDEGTCRSGVTLAQNLPNNDKLAILQGGGHRNVYHRQVRTSSSPDAKNNLQKKLNAILNPSIHKYYNEEADHWITIGHENVHSLGPKSGTEALGKNKSIIEENKADMGAIALLDCLTEAGAFTEEQKKEMIVTFATDLFLKAKPQLSQAHRVRSVMQAYYFIHEGAITFDEKGRININIDKAIPTARKMLTEIIEVQLSGNFNKGEQFVNKYFVWTDEMEEISKKIKENDKYLNSQITTPLADYLTSKA